MYDYENKENNIPLANKIITDILMFFPACNSLFGILFYSFLIYILKVLIRMFCSKPYNPNEDEEEINRNVSYDKAFKDRLEASRKKKAQEAEELLKKIS